MAVRDGRVGGYKGEKVGINFISTSNFQLGMVTPEFWTLGF